MPSPKTTTTTTLAKDGSCAFILLFLLLVGMGPPTAVLGQTPPPRVRLDNTTYSASITFPSASLSEEESMSASESLTGTPTYSDQTLTQELSASNSDSVTMTASIDPPVTDTITLSESRPSLTLQDTMSATTESSDSLTETFTMGTETVSVSLAATPTDTLSPTASLGFTELTVTPATLRRSGLRSGNEEDRRVVFYVTGTHFDISYMARLEPQFHIFELLTFDIPSEEAHQPYTLNDLRSELLHYKGGAKMELNRTSATLTFPRSERYFAVYDEVLNITFNRGIFVSRRANAWIAIKVLADVPEHAVPPPLAVTVEYWASLFSILHAFAGRTALPLLIAPWAVATLGLVRCDFQMGDPLPLYQHPTYLSIGSGRSRYHAGAAVMNTCLVAVVALFHIAVAQWRYERGKHMAFRGRPFQSALVDTLFPNLTILFTVWLWQPTVRSSLIVTLHNEDTALQAVGGVCFALWLLTTILLMLRVLLRFGALYIEQRPETCEEKTGDTKSPAKKKGKKETASSWCSSALTGHWDDDDFFNSGHRGFVQRYSCLFAAYRSRRHWFSVFEFGVGLTFAVLRAVHPKQFDCTAINVVAFLIAFLQLVLVAVLRPYNTNDSLLVVVALLAFATLGEFFMMLHDAMDAEGLRTVAAWCFLASSVLIAASATIHFGIWVRMTWVQRRLRRQALNEEHDREELRKFVGSRFVSGSGLPGPEGHPDGGEPPSLHTLLLGGPAVDGKGGDDGDGKDAADGDAPDLLLRHRVIRHPKKPKQRVLQPPGHVARVGGGDGDTSSSSAGDGAARNRLPQTTATGRASKPVSARRATSLQKQHRDDWRSDDDSDVEAAKLRMQRRVVGAHDPHSRQYRRKRPNVIQRSTPRRRGDPASEEGPARVSGSLHSSGGDSTSTEEHFRYLDDRIPPPPPPGTGTGTGTGRRRGRGGGGGGGDQRGGRLDGPEYWYDEAAIPPPSMPPLYASPYYYNPTQAPEEEEEEEYYAPAPPAQHYYSPYTTTPSHPHPHPAVAAAYHRHHHPAHHLPYSEDPYGVYAGGPPQPPPAMMVEGTNPLVDTTGDDYQRRGRGYYSHHHHSTSSSRRRQSPPSRYLQETTSYEDL